MVSSCCVKGCNSKAGQNIKFHKIPKGDIGEAWTKSLKKHNFLFKRTNSSKVCGLHFDSSLDYKISSASLHKYGRLKENAIPSIFNKNTSRLLFQNENSGTKIVTLSLSDLFTESSNPLDSVGQHLTIVPKLGENPVLLINPLVSVQSVEQVHAAPPELSENVVTPTIKTVTDQSSSNRKRKCFVGDFKSPSDIKSPNNRLKYWIASQSTINKQRKRIKYLHTKTVDLKKRIITLNNLVTHLKDKKMYNR